MVRCDCLDPERHGHMDDCPFSEIDALKARLAEYEAKDGQRTREHNLLVRENRAQAARLARYEDLLAECEVALASIDRMGASKYWKYRTDRITDSADAVQK